MRLHGIRSIVMAVAIGAVVVGAVPLVRAMVWSPSAEIPEPARDVGRVFHGTLVQERFTVHNKGNAPLRILRLDAECGAKATLLSADTIQPGQSGEIEVAFDTTRAHVPELGAQAVPVKKSVTMTTNAAASRTVLVAVSATIEPELVASESFVVLNQSNPNEPFTKRISVRLSEATTATVLGVRSSVEGLAAELVDDHDSNPRTFDVIVVQQPNTRLSWPTGNIVIATTSTAMPEFRIPVRNAL